MQVERVKAADFVTNPMPDGSRIIRDSGNENVFALNTTAGAAWDACASATTIAGVAEQMRRSLDPNVTEELAEASILELQNKNLVTISGMESKATRRQVLAGLGAVALPLVVSLTLGEQKAHAERASSVDPRDGHDHSHPYVPKDHGHSL
jgi:type IV secretory pathway VirJ component